jgi:hypothetical protein
MLLPSSKMEAEDFDLNLHCRENLKSRSFVIVYNPLLLTLPLSKSENFPEIFAFKLEVSVGSPR